MTPENKTLSIKLDADHTRLSHILHLKELFSAHRGSAPVQIHFHSKTKALATLHIDSKWGVTMNDQVKQKIQSMSCVLSIEY